MISQIVVISVPVADQARAKRFYAEKLGFGVEMDVPDAMGPGKSWIMLKPKDGGTSITLVNWFETMPAGCLRGLVLTAADLDAEYARLKTAKVDIDAPRQEAWGRFSTLRDSEGNGLVLQQAR
jgi:catechol 2,3-dioxygenase-like lactoylglutathione lyase family enzyme